MIDLYFFPTPNGQKISIALEELRLPYTLKLVNILKREQYRPSFLAVSPNNKIPAIVDHEGPDQKPLSLFESGAILLYLAEKTGKLMPADPRDRYEVVQWLMWQMGGLGPFGGQANHFNKYAPEKVPYGIQRYTTELTRLYSVMDHRLEDRDYLAGAYSIADIACYGWVAQWKDGGQQLSDHPRLHAWFERLGEREGVQRGMAVGVDNAPTGALDADEHASLFANDQRN